MKLQLSYVNAGDSDLSSKGERERNILNIMIHTKQVSSMLKSAHPGQVINLTHCPFVVCFLCAAGTSASPLRRTSSTSSSGRSKISLAQRHPSKPHPRERFATMDRTTVLSFFPGVENHGTGESFNKTPYCEGS